VTYASWSLRERIKAAETDFAFGGDDLDPGDVEIIAARYGLEPCPGCGEWMDENATRCQRCIEEGQP